MNRCGSRVRYKMVVCKLSVSSKPLDLGTVGWTLTEWKPRWWEETRHCESLRILGKVDYDILENWKKEETKETGNLWGSWVSWWWVVCISLDPQNLQAWALWDGLRQTRWEETKQAFVNLWKSRVRWRLGCRQFSWVFTTFSHWHTDSERLNICKMRRKKELGESVSILGKMNWIDWIPTRLQNRKKTSW